MTGHRTTFTIAKLTASVVALVALSADVASATAARVLSATHLRQGPGTNYGITTTVPRGAIVEISQCSVEWCTAHWQGRVGYLIATNLDRAAPGPVGGPPAVYVEPAPVIYGPPYFYYGPRYGGPRYFWWPW